MQIRHTYHMKVLAWPARKFAAWNPYTRLLYTDLEPLGVSVDEFTVGRLIKGRYDIWHLHWPEHFLNVSGHLEAAVKAWCIPALMDVAHTCGTKIVWTTHNLGAHEKRIPTIEQDFWARFVKRIDGFISLSQSAYELTIARHPILASTPGFVIPHGHFRDEYPKRHSRTDARRILGIDAGQFVILNFGAVRAYKGIPELISAFHELNDSTLILMIVGSCRDESLERAIRAEGARDPRIMTRLQVIPADEVQLYFAAADLVVLPYKEILNSGGALLSLSFDKPVCVPALGSMPELRRSVGDLWLRTYDGDLSAKVLKEAVAWARLDRAQSISLSSLDWQELRRSTVNAYHKILHNDRKREMIRVLQPHR